MVELRRKGRAPLAELRLIFVEGLEENYNALVTNLAPHLEGPGNALTFHGSIQDLYPRILELIGNEPALFFLDPWGVEGLSAKMIHAMLDGDRREVLVLFSDESTDRLRGAVRAPEPAPIGEADLPLFPDDPAPPARKPRKSYKPADEAILNDVFAGLWHLVDQTAEHNPGRERESYLDSYLEVQKLLGAEFLLPMSITDELDRHVYYLVHGSKSPRAFVVMKDSLHAALNKRAREPGAMQSFEIGATPVGPIADEIASHFAGRTVRWQHGHDVDTVKEYALQNTWALVSDLPSLKEELRRRGFLVKSWPATYRFPAGSAA